MFQKSCGRVYLNNQEKSLSWGLEEHNSNYEKNLNMGVSLGDECEVFDIVDQYKSVDHIRYIWLFIQHMHTTCMTSKLLNALVIYIYICRWREILKCFRINKRFIVKWSIQKLSSIISCDNILILTSIMQTAAFWCITMEVWYIVFNSWKVERGIGRNHSEL